MRLALGQWKPRPASSMRSRRVASATTLDFRMAMVALRVSGWSTSYIAGGWAVEEEGPLL